MKAIRGYVAYNSGDRLLDAQCHQEAGEDFSNWSRMSRDIRPDFLLANEDQMIAAYHYRCARQIMGIV